MYAESNAKAHINASLCTYKQIKAFGIQPVKSVMSLYEANLGDDIKYHYKEALTASSPINDTHRNK